MDPKDIANRLFNKVKNIKKDAFKSDNNKY